MRVAMCATLQSTTPFLRNGLNPILAEFHCAAIICHHTPKTTYRDTREWNATDWMYAGAGNADITNWARAILVIDATPVHGAFIFRAAKRGSRIKWADDDGHPVYDRLFCHRTSGGIFWREATDADMEQVALFKRGKPLKTKQEFKALVPMDEAIPKLALIERANLNGFGLNHAKRLLANLIAGGELHEWRVARKGTNPEIRIARREQVLQAFKPASLNQRCASGPIAITGTAKSPSLNQAQTTSQLSRRPQHKPWLTPCVSTQLRPGSDSLPQREKWRSTRLV